MLEPRRVLGGVIQWSSILTPTKNRTPKQIYNNCDLGTALRRQAMPPVAYCGMYENCGTKRVVPIVRYQRVAPIVRYQSRSAKCKQPVPLYL